MAKTTLQLKNLKTAGGDETLRFEATLYIDGKRSATVSNGGTGGSHCYYFVDPEARAKFDQLVEQFQTTLLNPNANRLYYNLVEMLSDLQAAIPTYSQAHIDRDFVIDCLIEQLNEEKQFRRWCKSATVFRLPEDAKGQYRTIKQPYSPRIRQYLQNLHGQSVEIVNEWITPCKSAKRN